MSGINIKIGTISTKFHYPYEGIFGKASPGPEYIIKTLTGNGYINLTNAIANQLTYLKLFGGIRQGLPAGYTQLDGITGDGNAYIDLNMKLTEDDEADVYFTKPSNLASSNVFGGRTSAGQNNMSVIIAGTGNAVLDFNNSDYTDYRLNTAISLNTTYKAVLSKSGRYIYQGETLIDSNTIACEDTIETPGVYLFHLAGSGLTSKFAGTINRVVIKGKKDLIPCKDSNDVVGMYDVINGVFYTNANETGNFTAGNTTSTAPTPTAPIGITCNNGTYGYQVTSDNKFDTDHTLIDLGHYYTANGGVYSDSATNFILTKKIPVIPGVKYVFYGRQKEGNRISSYNRIHFFKEDGTFLSTGTYPMNQIGVGTAPANASYALLSCNASGESAASGTPCTLEYIDSYNWTFKAGTSEGTFEPFVGGLGFYGAMETVADELNNTATAENLFAIGNIKDVQEILNGHITRNVGILVLDGITAGKKIGTAWNATYKRGSFAISDMASTASSVSDAISSHFEYSSSIYGAPTTNGFCTNNGSIFISFLGLNDITSAETANQWLLDQYVAGTPVVVVYPLATPTTETVTGQPLDIQDGNNRIEIAQASIDKLPLEVQYKATA